jgi:hypothetical protein
LNGIFEVLARETHVERHKRAVSVYHVNLKGALRAVSAGNGRTTVLSTTFKG